MFTLDHSRKTLIRLKKRGFAELNFQERPDLQEWLVRTPDALGEELLIVQKEFDGFADTRERLDILALDKEGRLVVIENKLDDSGRDAVWQVMKYAAYCSRLKKSQIINIYQEYLGRRSESADAEAKICDFLGVTDLDDVVLNPRNEQRLVLVAGSFRKEVTAAVLWLLGHGVQAQCFRVLPYSIDEGGERLIIDVQQIIPTPEAADYMIEMAAKDSEDRPNQKKMRRSHRLRREFWAHTLEALRARGASRFENIGDSADLSRNWIGCVSETSGCRYALNLLQSEVRVDLYLNRSIQKQNKWIFDQLHGKKEKIERDFGNSLFWQRLDDRKACRISISKPIDGFNEDNWPVAIEWICDSFERLERCFSPYLIELNRGLKSDQSSLTPAIGRE